jgi:hypothetical protein
MAISKIASAGITADFDNTLTAADLAPNSVDTSELVDDAVTTAKITALNVTAAKVASDVATTAGTQTFTNKTLTAPTLTTPALTGSPSITLGSDATGDVYYRAAGGALTRLATGADGTVLTSTGAAAVPAFEAIPAATVSGTLVGYAFYNGNGDTFKITVENNKTYYAYANCYHISGAKENSEVYKFVVDGSGGVTVTQSIDMTGDFGPNVASANLIGLDTNASWGYPKMFVFEGTTGVDDS